MELSNFLSQVPVPVLILVIALLVIVTAVVVYQYAKAKGLEGIRKDVYALFLVAEHEIKGTKQGQQRLKWVAVFVPLTFVLMDKMGQLHPNDDEEIDPEEDTYL